ncbi:MAG: DUF1254 domain-containing protein, partial [Caulobacter sp.]
MNRREWLAMAAAAGVAPQVARAQDDPAAAARDAWLFALPWVEMAATRAKVTDRGARQNRLYHRKDLAGPNDRNVTTPNNDTLYSLAWIDVSKGPVSLTLPASGTRYVSVAILNMWTENDAVLGTRVNGGGGGTFTIVGPGAAATGEGTVRLSTPHGWVLVRTLVDGPADLE